MTRLLVLDVVGLTPRAARHMPRLRRLGSRRLRRPRSARAARRHLLGAVDLPHRPLARRARHRRQRLVLPRPRRGLPVAPAQRAGRRGTSSGTPRAASHPGAPGGQHLLVVRHGRGRRLDRHAAPGLPRRRPQGARLLHLPAGAARPARRASSAPFPLFQLLGSDRVDRLARAGSSRPTRILLPEHDLTLGLRARTSTTTCSASARTSPRRAPAARDARRRAGAAARRRRARRRQRVVRSASTASPPSTSPSTSTGRCAAPACSRCTPRPGWSTSTRGPRGPSPSPTTRSPTSTSRDAERRRAGPRAARGRPARGRPRCSTGPARRPTASTTSARRARRRRGAATRGSPTTTGSTTSARPTSPGPSRSTASPATTRPSCSSTPPTAR